MVPEEFIVEATGLLGDNNIHELSEERFVGTLVYPVADPAGATLTVREREADPRVTPQRNPRQPDGCGVVAIVERQDAPQGATERLALGEHGRRSFDDGSRNSDEPAF